jgi:LuxR family transcriptional regulator, transcriptional regulator of spore coat protein
VTAGKDARGKSLLTTREREVFELLVQDKTTKEIADTLFISEKTVRNHISNLMHTLCKQTLDLSPMHRKQTANSIQTHRKYSANALSTHHKQNANTS